MPLLPLILSCGDRQREAVGLLDTGAAVNVLPYSLGEQLGLRMGRGKDPAGFVGNLARLPARGVSDFRIRSGVCPGSFGVCLNAGGRCTAPFRTNELLLGV